MTVVDPYAATPDDVEAPDPYAEPTGLLLADRQDDEARSLDSFGLLFRATTLKVAPVDADELVRRSLAKRTNRPGFCLQEQRMLADIPALWPNASTAARNAVGLKPGIGPAGAYAYWTGGAEGDGHIADFLPNGLIRSTDAAGSGLWGTRSLEWFNTNWHSLTYVGWADNTNGYRVPGVHREWDEMATQAEIRGVVDAALDVKFAALNLRIDGLVERQQKILSALESIDLELDGAATREQVAKARAQIRELKLLLTP